MWGRYCWTDASTLTGTGTSTTSYGLNFDVIGDSGATVEIMAQRPQWSQWRFTGGMGHLVSKGADGFLGIAVDLDPCNNTNDEVSSSAGHTRCMH